MHVRECIYFRSVIGNERPGDCTYERGKIGRCLGICCDFETDDMPEAVNKPDFGARLRASSDEGR